MQRRSVDGIPPTPVTAPTWWPRLVALVLGTCAALLFSSLATSQHSTGAPSPPEPGSEATRSVPEPDTLVLFAAGVALLGFYHLQRRRRTERRASTA